MFSDTGLIVGVDVHRRTNVIQVMNGQGDVVDSSRRFANNGTGTCRLARHLDQVSAPLVSLLSTLLLKQPIILGCPSFVS